MSIETFGAAFVTLFVIIDPIGLVPLFAALTRDMDAVERRRTAVRAVAIATALLALFGLAGQPLLNTVGITIPAFRIAGGLLLFLTAVDMLFEKRTERRERRARDTQDDPSVFPLAMPLIAGPGALATMILLAGQSGDDALRLLEVHLAMFAVLSLTLVLLLAGGAIGSALGQTGITVVTRLLGMLLAALAVQFVLDGLAESGLFAQAAT